jgi:hypothetical protein
MVMLLEIVIPINGITGAWNEELINNSSNNDVKKLGVLSSFV